MRELFVYYRVRPAQAAALAAAVNGMQAQLRQRHRGLIARVLRRVENGRTQVAPPARTAHSDDASETCETWMEVYAVEPHPAPDGMPAGITAEIQVDIEAGAEPLLSMIEGPRRVEAFEP